MVFARPVLELPAALALFTAICAGGRTKHEWNTGLHCYAGFLLLVALSHSLQDANKKPPWEGGEEHSHGLRCLEVGVEGFDPPASCSQSRRATKLRYTPMQQSLAVSRQTQSLPLPSLNRIAVLRWPASGPQEPLQPCVSGMTFPLSAQMRKVG